MKKLISIILTACICLSLLGGISFAGAEDTATEVTFDFTKTNNDGYTNADSKTSGTDWYWNCGSVSGSNVPLQNYGIQIKTGEVNQYVALTINVPVGGKYFPELYHYQNFSQSEKGAGGYGAVYLIPGKADKNAIETAIESGTNKVLSGIQYFSTIGEATYDTAKSNVAVEIFAGENTLIFVVESASDSETYVNTTRMWPTSLTLKPFVAKTYTFNKSLTDGSLDSQYTGNLENTIVPVYKYGTHGYKYFDADNETYENARDKAVNALQFSGSGYFRLFSVYPANTGNTFNNTSGAKLALAFEKPYAVPSFYAVSLFPNSSDNTATAAEFYMENINSQKTAVEEYTVPESRNGGSYNFNLSSAQGKDNELDELVYCNGKDDLMISFFTGVGGNLRISSLTLTPVDVSTITLNAPDSLEVDETSTVKVMAGEKSVVDSFVTYTVAEETDVIDVAADGTVTAKAAGTARITATVGELSDTATIIVTEPEKPEAAPTDIKYGVFVNEKVCAADVTANGVMLDGTTGLVTGTLNQGKTLTATAKDEASGYTFRYWVLGSAATGRYYSSNPTVTVTPYANIALTAIYTANSTGNVVDLFNYNGEFLKTLTNLRDLATEKPTMIGHTFANKWLIDKETELTADTTLTAPVTQAVAQYTKNPDYEVENINKGSTYGWTRNGKLVTYDEDYTFLTWLNGAGTIAENKKEITDKIPLAVLESKDGAYMLEYDKGEYEVVEAGILFGENGAPTVESATSKAKVSEKYLSENKHGQMTATSMTEDESEARGYVMYKDTNDNNKIKVIYSK